MGHTSIASRLASLLTLFCTVFPNYKYLPPTDLDQWCNPPTLYVAPWNFYKDMTSSPFMAKPTLWKIDLVAYKQHQVKIGDTLMGGRMPWRANNGAGEYNYKWACHIIVVRPTSSEARVQWGQCQWGCPQSGRGLRPVASSTTSSRPNTVTFYSFKILSP